MKKVCSLLLLLSFLSSVHANGQGWQWGRGNTGGGMDGWPVATDPSGNVFAAGIDFGGATTYWGPGDSITYSTGGSGYQTIMVKYDGNGNYLWGRGTSNGDSYIMNIATDQSGNSFLFGTVNGPSLQIGGVTMTNAAYPAVQYFLAKFDPNGNLLWVKNEGGAQGTYVSAVGSFVLGTGGISTDATGNIYITCNFSTPSVTVGSFTLTNADPSGLTDDILVAKYDPSGNVLWAKKAGGSGADDAYGLAVTSLGDVYIAGVFSSSSIVFGPSTISGASSSASNAFIARYNQSGTPTWACSSGGSGGELAVGVAADAANNVYLTGGLIDNSISFSGTTITNPYPGSSVLYLVKFKQDNTVDWFKTIGASSSSTSGYCIAMSLCNTIWVSGILNGPVNIDGHTLMPPDASSDPVFIAGFNTSGTYAGSAALQSGGDDQNGIACDRNGNVFMCSDYTAETFIVGNDTLAGFSGSLGSELLYVAKYTYTNSSPTMFSLGNDTATCSPILLHVPLTNVSFQWQNGSTDSFLVATAPGTYYVTVNDSGCYSSDTIRIGLIDVSQHLRDTSFCVDENPSIELKANIPSGSTTIWSTGSTDQEISVNQSGAYWVTVTNGNCVGSDTMHLNAEICNCIPFLPNAFSPNNDGNNDYYHPRFINGCSVNDYSFIIIDRWGEVVFQSNDQNAKWDGKLNNTPAELGVYMYYLKYSSGINNKKYTYKGDITLVR